MKKFILLICILSVTQRLIGESTIFIIPFPGTSGDELFDYTKCERHLPFYLLRDAFSQLGYNLECPDLKEPIPEFEYILVFDVQDPDIMQKLPLDKPEKCILFVWEPPTIRPYNYYRSSHQPYHKIFTLVDLLVDNQKYFKFYFPQPRLEMTVESVPFENKKLCTFIARNHRSPSKFELYTERLSTINFFEKQGSQDFDFYGVGWLAHQYKNYKGPVKTKKEVLKNYKFYICYENTRDINGYITEKIFDCFMEGCVPIYWGSQNVTKYIPTECFIDRRRFSNNEELYQFLKSISKDEYEKYLAAIKRFLQSDAAFLFSSEFFIDTVIRVVKPSYDMDLVFTQKQQEKLHRARKLNDHLKELC